MQWLSGNAPACHTRGRTFDPHTVHEFFSFLVSFSSCVWKCKMEAFGQIFNRWSNSSIDLSYSTSGWSNSTIKLSYLTSRWSNSSVDLSYLTRGWSISLCPTFKAVDIKPYPVLQLLMLFDRTPPVSTSKCMNLFQK